MIPHRMVSKEIFGNDHKHRLAACRKRLRLNRIHRVNFDNQVEELLREIAIGAAEFCDHSRDHLAMRETSVESVYAGEAETLHPVDEQEVGIT